MKHRRMSSTSAGDVAASDAGRVMMTSTATLADDNASRALISTFIATMTQYKKLGYREIVHCKVGKRSVFYKPLQHYRLEGIRTDIITVATLTLQRCVRGRLCAQALRSVISNMTAAEQSMGYIPSNESGCTPSLSSTSSGSGGGGSTSSRDIDQLVESARLLQGNIQSLLINLVTSPMFRTMKEVAP